MLRLTFSSLWALRRRMASIGLAVALAVAFLTGTLVLGDTLSSNFDRLFTQASAGTDVVVRNATSVDDAPDATRGLIDARRLAPECTPGANPLAFAHCHVLLALTIVAISAVTRPTMPMMTTIRASSAGTRMSESEAGIRLPISPQTT